MSSSRTVPLGRLFKRNKLTGFPNEPLLSLYREFGVIPKDSRDDNHNVESLDLTPYQLVEPGDLVINKMKAWQGSVAVSTFRGIVSPAYYVARQKMGLNGRFLHYLLRADVLIAEYACRSIGVRVGQWDLPWEAFAEIQVKLPESPCQTAIANFLDRKTAAIDAAIANKQALIADLLKYREAVIAEAVAPREGWRKARLKHLVSEKICTGVGEAGSRFEQAEPRYLRTSDIQSLFKLRPENVRTLPVEVAAQARVHQGDILLTTAGSVGKTYFHDEPGDFCYAGFLARIRIGRGHVPRFFAYVLSSQTVGAAIEQAKVSSTIDNFSASKCGELWLPVPPVKEQFRITEHLDKACTVIDAALAKAEEAVAMLNAYRASLISEAVTGKLDIPE